MITSSINPHSAILNPQSERLWRVRKQGASIDARLRASEPSGDVELQYFYEGKLVFAARWPTRDEAVVDADVRLRDLQRVGWTTHW